MSLAMRDLVKAAKDVHGPLIVLAHPGSGTQWTSWALRRAGHKGVQHEQISPGQQDPPWPGSVVVSYQYWPGDLVEVLKPARARRNISGGWTYWQMLRHPMRVAFSAGALCDRSPRTRRKICDITIRDDELREFAMSRESIVSMMISYVCHVERASELAQMCFRVEDIPAPKARAVAREVSSVRATRDLRAVRDEAVLHRNSHVKTVPRWDRLHDAASLGQAEEWFDRLREIAQTHRYRDEDRDVQEDSAPALVG